MVRYAIRRTLWGLVAILAVTLSVFVLFGPVLQWKSDTLTPARLYAGKNPSDAQIAQVERTYGLDRPVLVQYGIYMRRLVLGPSEADKQELCPNATDEECRELVGRLGRSFEKRRSVDQLIWSRVPVTFSLTLVAAVMWISISIPVGVISAVKPRSFFDRITMVFVLIGQSLPIYYFG